MRTDTDPDLSQFSTEWSLVHRAHRGTPEEAAAAQVELMGRYAGAIHRYLREALGDPDAADELDQEFAVRFLRGDFHRADPSRGRFRDFVKRSLRNLMIDDRRRRAARPRTMGDDLPETVDPVTADADFDLRFAESWRSELFARTWDGLGRFEQQTGQPYETALRLRVENPALRSSELARRASAVLGREVSEGAWRMLLSRSRERFVGLLIDEVAGTLNSPTAEDMEREFIDLGIQKYFRHYRKHLRFPG